MIGKPYSGKPNVRFDEGELEIEPSATTPALYSTATFTRSKFSACPPSRSALLGLVSDSILVLGTYD
jgi:hypothetical protein